MILNAYRFLICIILAFFIHDFGAYMLFSTPIPQGTGAFALAMVIWSLLDKMKMTFVFEEMYREVSGPDENET